MYIEAKRYKTRGKARKGMLIGIKKDRLGTEWKLIENEIEEIVHIRAEFKEEARNVILVYNTGSNIEFGNKIARIIAKYKNEELVTGGDFNIRIGDLGGEEEEGGTNRKSKNKTRK